MGLNAGSAIAVSDRRIRGDLGVEVRCDLAEGWRWTAVDMKTRGLP